MSIENARKFVLESQTDENLKEAMAELNNSATKILELAKELGYEFTPEEFVQAFVETLTV